MDIFINSYAVLAICGHFDLDELFCGGNGLNEVMGCGMNFIDKINDVG